jgi:hypothetical protein
MGYTHTWTRPRVINKTTYARMRQDFIQLMQNLPKYFPVPNTYYRCPLVLKGWDGISDLDLSDPDEFIFNGDASYQITVQWLIKEERDQLSHDTFRFDRKYHKHARENEEGIYSNFCKTATKPYDLAVCGCLLIAQHHLQEDFTLHSSGNIHTEQSWPEVRRLIEQFIPNCNV